MAEVFGVQELTMFSLNKELTSHLSNIPVAAPAQEQGGDSMDGGSGVGGGTIDESNKNRDGVDDASGDPQDMYDDEELEDDQAEDRDDDDNEDNIENEDENENEGIYDDVGDGDEEGEVLSSPHMTCF